jgi:hypothetical protein
MQFGKSLQAFGKYRQVLARCRAAAEHFIVYAVK